MPPSPRKSPLPRSAAHEENQPSPAPARRQRIDAVIAAIEKGEYDDKLPDLERALRARQELRKKDVLQLVQEVYGPGYQITAAPAYREFPSSDHPEKNLRNVKDSPEKISPESPFDLEPLSPVDPPPEPSSSKEASMEVDIENRGSAIGPFPGQEVR